jgi:hypothetical protein
MYIGYSAGGILISPFQVPKVFVAAPITLVERVAPLGAKPILNLMHYRDPVAAPIPSAENIVLKDRSFWYFVNPIAAHTECMNHPNVVEHVLRWYNEHVE